MFKISDSFIDVSGVAVEAWFDLVYCFLSVVGFVVVFDVCYNIVIVL